jgi:hypothetical protein
MNCQISTWFGSPLVVITQFVPKPPRSRSSALASFAHARWHSRDGRLDYNTIWPYSSIGNLVPVDHANFSAPAARRARQVQMANRLCSSVDEKRGLGQTVTRERSVLFNPFSSKLTTSPMNASGLSKACYIESDIASRSRRDLPYASGARRPKDLSVWPTSRYD